MSESIIYGKVVGRNVDEETRCAHYHGDHDIIAIKFKCCGGWYSCFDCHAELAGHAAEVWPVDELAERAVMCGGCGQQLAIREYLTCGSLCPSCGCRFNPGCARHHHLYFEIG